MICPLPIRIPKALPEKIVKDNSYLKPIAVFYQLKSFYKGGIILNYKSRWREICDVIGISESNLRRKLGMLREFGFIKTDKHITLISDNKIKELFDIDTEGKHQFNFTKNIESVIKAIVIYGNLKRQSFALKKKIVNNAVNSAGIYDGKIAIKYRNHVSKNYDKFYDKQCLRGRKGVVNGKKQRINTHVSLSRQGIATILGRKSKSSGTRAIKKLVTNSLAIDEPKYVFHSYCDSYRGFLMMELDQRFRYANNIVYRRMSNEITIKVL